MKTLHVIFKQKEESLKGLATALKNFMEGERKEVTENIVVFDSYDNFKKVITINRIDILCAIKALKPKSVYELATLLKKASPSVLADCEILEASGFIKLIREEHRGRTVRRPVISSDYDVIDVKGHWTMNISKLDSDSIAA